MSSYRTTGKNALNIVLNKETNINMIEKYVFETSEAQIDDNEQELEKIYIQNIYQVVGDIQNGLKLKDILSSIKNGKLGWEHTAYNEIKNRIDEQDGFIENPFQVEEGIFQCKSIDKKSGKICGSKRVFSYTRQVRSSDEPMSVYSTCVQCGSKWVYSG